MRLPFRALGVWVCTASAVFAVQPNQAELDRAIEAIDSARTAVTEALNKAPLGFRRILFVKDIPEGFAAYQPRADNTFRTDEPIIVYTEPIGVAWKKEGDEYSSKLVVDFEIRSPDGQVLAGQRGFGEFELDAREPPLDYMSHIKLDVTGAPEGSYILGITIHDTNSGKSATTDLPFEIK
ncbi:MAG TPA: hypothetical protein VFO09_03185 [Methyloceanibacter sp.]|jgi:hypothetical protein|nr:hypothetical protein [Methyloceanibacter sp.]